MQVYLELLWGDLMLHDLEKVHERDIILENHDGPGVTHRIGLTASRVI